MATSDKSGLTETTGLNSTMGHGGPQPFLENLDGSPGPRWEEWKRNFEAYMNATRVIGDGRLDWLQVYGGDDIRRLIEFLPEYNGDGALILGEYGRIIAKLDAYYKPKVLYVVERAKLRKMERKPNERVDAFIIRLRQQGSRCNYGDSLELIIIDQLIATCTDMKLKDKWLEKDLDLSELQSIAAAHELRAMNSDLGGRDNSLMNEVSIVDHQKKPNITSQVVCFACGAIGHIAKSLDCPARGKKCRKCGEMNHFEKRCRNRKRRFTNNEKKWSGSKKPSVACVETIGDNPYQLFMVGRGRIDLKCKLGGVDIGFLIDSGADVNVISYSQWKDFDTTKPRIWDVKPASDEDQVKGYDGPFKVAGTFMSELEFQDKSVETKFFVIRGGPGSLLSRDTSEELGVLKVGPEVNRAVKEFNKIKGIAIHLTVDYSVKPVRQPYRRVPVPLEERVNRKLEEMMEQGIIEPVNCPSPWVSQMVVEPKKNGDIRVCLDMRNVNKAVKRELHPLPTIEGILTQVKEARVFSLLDLEQGFHQVELDRRSRYLTTFLTSKGLMRYKRLLFGLNCAPEKFQKILESVLAGCSGCLNFIDDILVYGKDKVEHEKNLHQVKERLKGYNVKLNEEKCVYGVDEIEFLGFKLSAKGVNISEEKLLAVRNMKPPTNVNELRSFLGFVNFMKKFVPDMSTITAPLNHLLKGNQKFEWNSAQQEAFQNLKKTLSQNQTLGYYNADDRTEIVADASPFGLGAVLIQKNKAGEPRVICYASRSLSQCERRYAQTEREALAIVWACEKFHFYLYGKCFLIVTDHKPLEIIFRKNTTKNLRIQRWQLRLSNYTFKVIYKPGKQNIADVFSRLCQGDPEVENFDEMSDVWVRFVADMSRPVALTMDEVESESKQDKWIQKIKMALESDDWDEDLKKMEAIKNELCFSNEVLLRGTLIIIPKTLQERTLKLAHIAHAGEVGMKRILRTKVWWPEINDMIRRHIKGCKGCILNSLPDPPEPLERTTLPEGPWIDIAVDFAGPFPTGESMLVVVDYYSRFTEIEIMKGTTAGSTVHVFRKMFSKYGFPETLKADNGSQFISEEFKAYCYESGIKLKPTTPHSPQQNGEVERQNRTIKRFCRISQQQGEDWRDSIYDFVLMKNTTENETTGKTPSELFFGRLIRNKLPSIMQRHYKEVDLEVRDRDAYKKQQGKEAADKARHARRSQIEIGDKVFVKNMNPKNKLDSYFSPELHEVIEKHGGEVVVENEQTKKRYRRNVTHVKKAPEKDQLTDRAEDNQGEIDEDEDMNEPGPSKRPRREIKRPDRYLDRVHYV